MYAFSQRSYSLDLQITVTFQCGKKVSLSIWAVVTRCQETGWLVNHQNLFLTVLGAGKSRMKALAWWRSVRASSRCIASTFYLCPHMVEEVRTLCVFSHKNNNPFHGVSPSRPNHLPKPSLLIPSTLDIKAALYVFVKDTNV